MDSDVGKLFIGGISWETTEEKLKSYFGTYGEVVEAVIMKDRATGRARGFGFVVFADPLVADRVVQEKHMIDGRMVEAKKAVPRDEQQSTQRSNNGGLMTPIQARTKKIFVGGLAATVSEIDFRKYFEQFGAITDVVVMYDHSTQRPRGFGFITYTSEDAVDKVLQKSFHELKDKMVEVKRAIPKELSTGPSRNNGGGLSPGMSRGSPYAGGSLQGFNSPTPPYGSRVDGRYSLSPGNTYSPYAGAGYAGSGSYNVNTNVGYGTNSYGGSGTFGGNGFGGLPSAGSMYGGTRGGYGGIIASSGYGSTTPGRNLWSTKAGSYLGGSGSSLYAGNVASNLGGYGGLGTWGSTQNLSSGSGAYGSASFGYGSSDTGYGSTTGVYGGRGGGFGSTLGSAYGSSLGGYGSVAPGSTSGGGAYNGRYGDLYSSSGYGDTIRRSPGYDHFNSTSIESEGLGYGLTGNNSEIAIGDYDGGYAPGRQSHRGVPA